MWLIMLLAMLACQGPLCKAQEKILCDQQNWFYGFTNDVSFEFQAMDVTPDGNYAVVGGEETSTAILLARDIDNALTLNFFVIASTDFPGDQPTILGVEQIKLNPDGSQAVALLETDASNAVSLVQFTLGNVSSVRLVHRKNADINYSYPVFLLRSVTADQIDILYHKMYGAGISQIFRLHFDFNPSGVHYKHLAWSTTFTDYIIDATVTSDGKLLMLDNWTNLTGCVLIKYRADPSDLSTHFTHVQGVQSSMDRKIIETGTDTATFVTMSNVEPPTVRFVDLDTSDANDGVQVVQSTDVSFPGTDSLVLESVKLKGSVPLAIFTTDTGYTIVEPSVWRTVTFSRASAWIFETHPLLDAIYVNTGGSTIRHCQFGISATHLEARCDQYNFGGSSCSTFAELGSVTSATTSVPSFNYFTNSNGAASSVPDFSTDDIETTEEDLSAATPTSDLASNQIVNPCGIVPTKFEDDLVSFELGQAEDATMQVQQEAVAVGEQCPNPSDSLGDSQAILAYLKVQLEGAVLEETTDSIQATSIQFMEFLDDRIVFHPVEGWQAGIWEVIYLNGYAATMGNQEWLIAQSPSDATTAFQVTQPCVPELTAPVKFEFSMVIGDPQIVFEFPEITNGDCRFDIQLQEEGSMDLTLIQPEFGQVYEASQEVVFLEANGTVTIPAVALEDVGTHQLTILVSSLAPQADSLTVPLIIDVTGPLVIDETEVIEEEKPCTADLQMPEISDLTISQGVVPYFIDLVEASNGSCRFGYELLDSDLQVADPGLFNITQPTFEGEDFERMIYSPGYIAISPFESSHVGDHSLVLLVSDEEGNSGQVAFEVKVIACESIIVEKEIEVDILYVIGSGRESNSVFRQNEHCLNSNFTIKSVGRESHPDFIDSTEGGEGDASINIDTESVEEAGEYTFQVLETDILSKKVALTVLHIYVDTEENIAEIADRLSKGQNSMIAEQREVKAEFSPQFFKKQSGYRVPEQTPDHLRASVYDISPTGNLTIVFNKPIILPPLELNKEQVRRLESEANSFLEYSLKDVLKVYLESVYHEDDSKETKVLDFWLTRLTKEAFDVQIDFNEPQSVTPSLVEPDRIKVDFKISDLFIDEKDFMTFSDKEQFIEFDVQPQFTKERLDQLEEFAAVVETALMTFSVGNLAINLLLGAGLKLLWNMVTLLQFVVFMRKWLVLLPAPADIFLKKLKTLALFEFLPTKLIKDFIIDELGIDLERREDGVETLFDKLSVFLIAAFFIVVIVVVLFLLSVCVKKCPRVAKCYEAVKAKVFYNTFIRYLILGTLKIQLTFGGAIFIGSVIPETRTEIAPAKGQLVTGIMVLILMTLAAPVFGWVLYVNRQNLHKPEIEKKIGTMYFGLNSEKPKVWTYVVVFLLRRSLFVLVTFSMYYLPSLQVEVMIYSTIFYLAYITNMSFYETTSQRRVEVMNECILVAICYHFVIFANPSFKIEIREILGISVICFVCLLLTVNTILIAIVTFSATRQRCRRNRARKEVQQQIVLQRAQRVAAKPETPQKIEAVVQRNQKINTGAPSQVDAVTNKKIPQTMKVMQDQNKYANVIDKVPLSTQCVTTKSPLKHEKSVEEMKMGIFVDARLESFDSDLKKAIPAVDSNLLKGLVPKTVIKTKFVRKKVMQKKKVIAKPAASTIQLVKGPPKYAMMKNDYDRDFAGDRVIATYPNVHALAIKKRQGAQFGRNYEGQQPVRQQHLIGTGGPNHFGDYNRHQNGTQAHRPVTKLAPSYPSSLRLRQSNNNPRLHMPQGLFSQPVQQGETKLPQPRGFTQQDFPTYQQSTPLGDHFGRQQVQGRQKMEDLKQENNRLKIEFTQKLLNFKFN